MNGNFIDLMSSKTSKLFIKYLMNIHYIIKYVINKYKIRQGSKFITDSLPNIKNIYLKLHLHNFFFFHLSYFINFIRIIICLFLILFLIISEFVFVYFSFF